MYESEEDEEHLRRIPIFDTRADLHESDSDDDSNVEIVSNVDENENELIEWTTYLRLNSDDNEDSGPDDLLAHSSKLVAYSSSNASSDEEEHNKTSRKNNEQTTLDSFWKK